MSGHPVKASRDAGKLYRVILPAWRSGGLDIHADSPAEAALEVGCNAKANIYRDVPPLVKVCRHLPGSQIGLARLEECGVFPTLTADHYDI